ncbi:ethanolamine-phosphate phospho-lyase-like isoform X2 [Pollicipes pollicipes]|uniref:ethanolamine-phosphate phospho-lyase-like isoform X2 n=2 Tax=Pollicipes pollicipes TaxID=41117 RepID=UPI001884B78A|nr:ethanolamine-phosphate phospho-lyase-like isoform X2 [Pollicipes pollicipes]
MDVTTPELTKEEIVRLRDTHIGRSCQLFFREAPLMIVRGEGIHLYDETGQAYLDGINNVCHVGHCHPDVVGALCRQAAALNTNSRFLHQNIVLYAKKLTATFPESLSIVYMVNSGSEANDLALRLAKAHTKASDVITLDHAYHGHVTSTMEISPYKFKKGDRAPKSGEVHLAPCPDTYRGEFRDASSAGQQYAEKVQDIIAKLAESGRRPAAFIAESLQSCGGQILPPTGYLRAVYEHVRAAGGVCIADEVQVGFGRVGTHWWAFQTQGDDVIPDIVTLGKPMGNGHPVAAVVTTQEVAESFAQTGVEYFNTYGGNPVSCAVAMAVMKVIENEKLMENCLRIEEVLGDGLQRLQEKYPIIGDIRIMGMFAGIDLVTDRGTRAPATDQAKEVVTRMLQGEDKVLLSTDGPHRNVLKFKPPIVFSEENCQLLLRKLDQVLAEVTADKERAQPPAAACATN